MLEVVAAFIRDKEKFLICQRPEGKNCAFGWEVPGGKIEAGETKAAALIRECREELCITVKPLDIFIEVVHEYPDLTVHLILYNAVIAEGEIKLLEHNDARWITPEEIPMYAFCPADKEILERIMLSAAQKEGPIHA